MTTLSRVIPDSEMNKIISQFSRLGEKSYLDNAGASIYPQSLLELINNDLMKNVYMNPHSDKYTKDSIDHIRYLILNHFNTDLSKYAVIFTSGTTQSLKLVVESFQFNSEKKNDKGLFVYLLDNHTSVLGLREIAGDKEAYVTHISHQNFLKAVSNKNLVKNRKKLNTLDRNALFVYPAQSNFNGFKYPLDCIEDIKHGCLGNYVDPNNRYNWYVMLDAASFLPTNKLDLTMTNPDFVCMSFYKMFGYPTGLGALLVKRSSIDILSRKKYFGGGTVDVVLSSEDFHIKRKDFHERFEDGTINFLSVVSLKYAINMIHNFVPKVVNNDLMDTISYHTFFLARDLYKQLSSICHKNGQPAAVLYMDSNFSDVKLQGAIVTFNIVREDGSHVGYAEFQHMADLFEICIRTGCFCNSGSCQRHFNATNADLKEMYNAGHVCGDGIDLIEGKPTGAVRASFAYYNTFKDVDKLIRMITRCYVSTSCPQPNREKIKLKNVLPVASNEPTEPVYYEMSQMRENKFVKSDSKFQGKSKFVLKEIVIYPIKSCGAFKVDSGWMIGPKGLQYDREWMIIQENGVGLTQKNNNKMCTISPNIDLDNNLLILNCPDMRPLKIPLNSTSDDYDYISSSVCEGKVCSDRVLCSDCGDEVAEWISEALETSFLRLIKQKADDTRTVKNKKSQDSYSKLLSLTNQAQFLLINRASVRWLREQIRDKTFKDNISQMTDRFRGNFIIDSDQPLAEKDWQRITIGNLEFKVEGPCTRCQMVCIDQQTGEKTVEPLRTIAEQFEGKLRFGIYLSYVGSSDPNKETYLFTNMDVNMVDTASSTNR